MFSLFKKKSNLPEVSKNQNCLNCGFPFQGFELFCPECGQKNNKEALNFKNFMGEVFQGFTSWDAKFWKTIIPLLTKPGKVSRDFIEGKRSRYTNPFRFYITTSILFFLLVGLIDSINDYQEFAGIKKEKNITNNPFLSDFNKGFADAEEDNKKEKNTKKSDTITKATVQGKDITHFVNLQRKYPDLPVEQALDSLNEEKTLLNRFIYKKAGTMNSFAKNPRDNINKLFQNTTSYLSTAIFILLPIFALFLKLIYLRREFTYVEHLIFIFHTQTVLFLLLILFYPLNVSGLISNTFMYYTILLLFLVYLFIAMKVFYKQNYFKTSLKFLMTITTYVFLSGLTSGLLTFIAFALY